MDIYENIKERKSIRNFKSDDVPLETVNKIIEAARYAPSWGNKQCWRFIVVDSKVEKNIIGKASGQANISKACQDAPYVIVIGAVPYESGSKNGVDYSVFDCALAMENLVLAAQEEGLATCIVGWFDEKAIRAVLNVPAYAKILAFTPLGYANEIVAPRSRRKQEETVFHNFWGKPFEG